MKGKSNMAQFDLSQYETVEERHARALAEYPDMRVEIINRTTENDRAQSTWVVEARVYMNAGDQSLGLFKASEWAFEVDGVGMANKTSALENAATSALGRALRWAFAGSKGASRTEMEKVARGVTPKKGAQPMPEWEIERISQIESLDELKQAWADAVAGGWSAQVQDAVTARKKELS